MVRLLRIARILKFFRALRILVYQIIGTVRAICWALVLMLMIIYVFSIIFVQSVSDFLAERDEANFARLKFYWGSLPRTMFTLYKSATGGVDWENVILPLSDIHWIVVFLFLVFISFVLFAVLNTVTGVFCQKAIESAAHDHDTQIREQILEKALYMRKTRELFKQMGTEDSSFITYHQFHSRMQDERVLAYFAIMGLDHHDAWDLFRLLDADKSASIDLEEFVRGFMRLRGTAKSIDIAKLSYENRQMRASLAHFMRKVDIAMVKMQESLSEITKGEDEVAHI